ncbi:hypothetical protein ACOME3_004441 [Neoechinorhynchus agilis]
MRRRQNQNLKSSSEVTSVENKSQKDVKPETRQPDWPAQLSQSLARNRDAEQIIGDHLDHFVEKLKSAALKQLEETNFMYKDDEFTDL